MKQSFTVSKASELDIDAILQLVPPDKMVVLMVGKNVLVCVREKLCQQRNREDGLKIMSVNDIFGPHWGWRKVMALDADGGVRFGVDYSSAEASGWRFGVDSREAHTLLKEQIQRILTFAPERVVELEWM